ncbi:hypothetical protein HWV62_43764 [Athelia sp. TMB]|nr:hypothetical protein HWV62_43764 [Athelia sp. TMB]
MPPSSNFPVRSPLSLYEWTLERQDQPELAMFFYNQFPVYSLFFPACSPGALFKFARTCQAAHCSVQSWMAKAYAINPHLSRFFFDPVRFRNLQARTGSLISGSNALQFLDRTFYENSDLDLYVHSVHAIEVGIHLMKMEGYVYLGGHASLLPASGTTDTDEFMVDEMEARETLYSAGAIHDVLRFMRPGPNGSRLNLQLILTITSCFETVMRFHSTCVMNLISWDYAVALYPRATFELSINQRCHIIPFSLFPSEIARAESDATAAIEKYRARGKVDIPWSEREESKLAFFEGVHRYVGDNFCWTLPLDTTGIKPWRSEPRSPPRLTPDLVFNNGWTMVVHQERMTPAYSVLTSPLLKYNYICPSESIRNVWVTVLRRMTEYSGQSPPFWPDASDLHARGTE